jgi:hypothetical protein
MRYASASDRFIALLLDPELLANRFTIGRRR